MSRQSTSSESLSNSSSAGSLDAKGVDVVDIVSVVSVVLVVRIESLDAVVLSRVGRGVRSGGVSTGGNGSSFTTPFWGGFVISAKGGLSNVVGGMLSASVVVGGTCCSLLGTITSG